MLRSRRRFAWVLALCFATLASTARADKEQAREHFKKGSSFYTLERWDDAIREFGEAYAQEPDPVLLFNIAQSYRLSNRPKQAIDFYKKFLRAAPNTAARASVEEHIANLEKATSPPLEAMGPSRGNGDKLAPPTPPPPTPPATVTTTPPTVPPPAVAAAQVSQPPPSTGADLTAKAPPPRSRTWLWVGLGAGAAAVAVGVILAVVFATRSDLTTLSPESLR